MHILRTSPMLVRLVLVWFALTLGAAVAAPVLQSVSMTVVCTDKGARVVVLDADGAATHGAGHTLDCPLCLPSAPAPPPAIHGPVAVQPQQIAAPVLIATRVATIAGAPLPARGPPAIS